MVRGRPGRASSSKPSVSHDSAPSAPTEPPPVMTPARKVQQRSSKAAASSGLVRTTYRRVSLYPPPEVRRKFEEIAFTEDRKERDIYIEILRDRLKKKGHSGLL